MTSNLRAVTQAQRTAARARATTQAAPGYRAPSGPRVSHLEPGLLILQLDPIEDPITSPHPLARQGPLYSTQLPPEPPSLAQEEAKGLRLGVPSFPLMLSLGALGHIIKVVATIQVAARVDLIVAHQA